MPQSQNGPEGVARAAEVQHAHAEGQQAEHQGARAVHRPDARRQRPRDEQFQQPLHQERPDGELREGQHQDQRPVRLLRTHRVVVRRDHVARQHPPGPVDGRGQRQGRLRRARDEQVRLGLLDHLLDVHHPDGDGAVRARLHAGRGLPFREPAAAHVALAHDPLRAAVLRRLVGAGQRAVPAAEALVVEVLHDPRDRVLLVGIHGTGVQAGRVETVVAGRRDVLDDRKTPAPAVQQAHVAPGLLLLEAVQRVAGGDARLAARAGVEVHVEGVLLAGGRRRGRQEGRIALREGRAAGAGGVVRPRETLRGGDLLLLQIVLDERRRTRLRRGGGPRPGRRGAARGGHRDGSSAAASRPSFT